MLHWSGLLVLLLVTPAVVSQENSTAGSPDPCVNFECQNGGTCTAPATDPYCLCPPRYTGKNCEDRIITRNPCVFFECQNGGTCTSPLDIPYCLCPEEFTGEYCEQSTMSRDPCLSYSCENGGNCTSPLDVPYCECPLGFKGDRCEMTVDEKPGRCPQPKAGEMGLCAFLCVNDSTCPENEKCCSTACGGRSCSPPVSNDSDATAAGDSCNGYCLNGSTCTSDGGAPICQCPPGFSGAMCEIEDQPVQPGPPSEPDSFGVSCGKFCCKELDCPSTHKCCPSSSGNPLCTPVQTDLCQEHCLNGGACLLSSGVPVCQCPYGFSGSRCELSAEENHSGTCPDSQDGGVGICGGVFCTNDSQCDSSQKCCPSSCGGQLCTPVSLTTTPRPPNCNSVLCAMGMYCRIVVPCSTCQAEPRCVRSESLEKDLDSECHRKYYSQAVLIPEPRNSSVYSVLACRGSCPSESVCVYSEAGSGSCCRGYTGQVVPTEKPGVCPTGDFNLCGDILCTYDTDCPGAQKCCPSCGYLCADPVSDSMCGNSKCHAGYTCVQKQPNCRDGMMCIQAFVPTCVPDGCAKCKYNEDCIRSNYGFECFPAGEVNPCGGCADGQICHDKGIRCIKAPCPSFECIQLNECGGCPSGQVCERTKEVCKTEPCPSFQCVEKVTPDCPLRCGSGYACELQPKKCTTNSRTPCPSRQLEPTCVPVKPGLASCPRVTSRLSSSPLCWIQEKRIVKECTSDKECKAENSRCCTTACSKKACITVNKRVFGDD